MARASEADRLLRLPLDPRQDRGPQGACAARDGQPRGATECLPCRPAGRRSRSSCGPLRAPRGVRAPGAGEGEPGRQPVTLPPSMRWRCGVAVPKQHQAPLAQPVTDVGPCVAHTPFRRACLRRCLSREGSRPRRTSPWPAESQRPRWIFLPTCNMADGVRLHGRCAVQAFALTACTSQPCPKPGAGGPLWRIGETRRLEPLGPWPRAAAAPGSPDGVGRAPVPGSPAVRAGCERTHIPHRSPLRLRPWALPGWCSNT